MHESHYVIPINLITETLFYTVTMVGIGLLKNKKHNSTATLVLKEYPVTRCTLDLDTVIRSSTRALFGTSYRRANRIGTSSIEDERRQTYRISQPTNVTTTIFDDTSKEV